MKKQIAFLLSLVLILSGCSTTSAMDFESLKSTHIGAAILKEPAREAADNPYMDTGIYETKDYGKFTKAMTVYGITYISTDDVSDAFMKKIALITKEMFPETKGAANKIQNEVLNNLYKYKAVLPVVKSEESANKLITQDVTTKNSICDIIMVTENGQVMEVVEHILHAVTDVGLHHTLTKDFGVNESSTLYTQMQEAIKNKTYSVESYNEYPESIKNRILIQEYVYWLISSYWNLQEPYGNGDAEWSLINEELLKMQQPQAHKLLKRSIDQFMQAPSKQTLDLLLNDGPAPVVTQDNTNEDTADEDLGVNADLSGYTKYIDIADIKRDLSKLDSISKKYYSKYVEYTAPNGKPIRIIAQDKVTDEQLLKAYNILSFYLKSTDTFDKTAIANKIADTQAIINMPNGAHRESKLPEEAVQGQPLYANETPVPGHAWYIKNNYEYRDAAYEEILHFVHDYGVGTKSYPGVAPELQKQIWKATMNALPKKKNDWGKKGLWGLDSKDWLIELEQEGSLEQEYLASVVDSYYGLWGAFTENSGGMWGVYTSKYREDIAKNDPMGYEIVKSFLPEYVDSMMRIDPSFTGTFKMTFDAKTPYTHKSQYLKDVRLTGSTASNIEGNALDNIFIGNEANNVIDGKDGFDIVQFDGAFDDFKIKVMNDSITIRNKSKNKSAAIGVDLLKNIEILRFTDVDMPVTELN